MADTIAFGAQNAIHELHPLLRVKGELPTALETLCEALSGGDLPIRGEMPVHDLHATDPYQIDLALEIAAATQCDVEPPTAGATYAGLTPAQRRAFLIWTQDPIRPAPPAFQRLFMAHIEVGLLDSAHPKQALQRELIRLSLSPAWHMNEWHARVLLLGLWLESNGAGIAEWTSSFEMKPALLSTALGMQAVLNEDLRPGQVVRMASAWEIHGLDDGARLPELQLRSLTESIGQPPFDLVRQALTADQLLPRPWRTAHRALRFSIPQPDVRPILEPMILELLGMPNESCHVQEPAPAAAGPSLQDMDWKLVLEFGHSRSEFYQHVLDLAQRMPGYVQLLDEDRRLVHRVAVRKTEMRRFWRMWDYVQNWSSTRVYLDGEELEHWKIWPYSQYLR